MRLGVPDENIKMMTDTTTKDMQNYMMKDLKTRLQKASKENVKNGTESFLFVYCAGHGVADQQ